jgi:hypothetical protein
MGIVRTAEEILDDLIEDGSTPTDEETVALCEAAIAGELAQAQLDAFGQALQRAGWSVIDVTTDDDEGHVLQLAPPVEAE